MPDLQVAVLYHNYYSLTGLVDIRNRLGGLKEVGILLMASIAEKFFYQEDLRKRENECVIKATNKGKDIGGKLLLIDLFLKKYSQVPYMLFLHDKRSYQKYSGNFEKEKLYEILEPEVLSNALKILSTDKSVGIIAPKSCIKNEYNKSTKDFNTPNDRLLKKLLGEYQINTNDYSFVAGTMFLVRSSIMMDFFQQHSPLKVRSSLEAGNVLDNEEGTVTHSWERLLCWLATSKGFRIEGV